jgi:hypothetical protein
MHKVLDRVQNYQAYKGTGSIGACSRHPVMTEVLELAGKNFKASIVTLFKDVKYEFNEISMESHWKNETLKRTKWNELKNGSKLED